jgi:RNA polymerase sigma-70 factor (ECF subfamily)
MNDILPQSTDEEVVLLVQKGDKNKFGLLMERYNKKLFRYGKKFLSDSDNIEDIIQDVFINTYKNINNFNNSLKFSSWIYRIAHNAFIDGLRKQQKNRFAQINLDILVSHHFHKDDFLNKADLEMTKKMIDVGINQLKSNYKEVIILHYLEELGYKEISDILQIPVGTVGIRIMRGKDLLKKYYEKNNINYGKQ